MEYYPALNKKEILTCDTMWINLRNVILSKISQSQKDKYLHYDTYMRYLEYSKS